MPPPKEELRCNRMCWLLLLVVCQRVWPLNFVTAHFSAEHGAECVGVDISPDGQQVLCTYRDSAVELLNLTNQHHLPISRGHPARVVHASISGTSALQAGPSHPAA